MIPKTALLSFILFLAYNQQFSHGKFNKLRNQPSVEADPELEKYLREAIENFRDQMKEGIDAISMPVLDPLQLQNLNVEVAENLATLNLQIHKLNVRSLSKFNITKLEANLEHMYIGLNLSLPEIQVDGEYNMNGKMAKIFPMYGKGGFEINATGLDFFGKGQLGFTTETLELKLLKMDLIWNDLDIFMENFLGGGDFADVLLRILPDVGKKVFIMYKPLIIEKLEVSLKDQINEKLKDDTVKEIIKGLIPN